MPEDKNELLSSDTQTNIQNLSKNKWQQAHGSETGIERNSYLASLQISTVLWKQEKPQALVGLLSGSWYTETKSNVS